MGRVNKYKLYRTKRGQHWVDYGRWLEYSRGLTELTQDEVAKTLGISRRQWIRYTKGAPVPKKRIRDLVKVLGLPPGKAYLRAGYQLPRDLNAEADSHLRHIRDAVFEGGMADALAALFSFYYEMAPEKKKHKSIDCTSTCQDFINAAIALDGMPRPLRQEFTFYLLAIEKGHRKHEFPLNQSLRKKILAMIKKDLPLTMWQKGRITSDEMKSSDYLDQSRDYHN
jgi:transcriptional regulator with XRE-family HTH domain